MSSPVRWQWCCASKAPACLGGFSNRTTEPKRIWRRRRSPPHPARFSNICFLLFFCIFIYGGGMCSAWCRQLSTTGCAQIQSLRVVVCCFALLTSHQFYEAWIKERRYPSIQSWGKKGNHWSAYCVYSAAFDVMRKLRAEKKMGATQARPAGNIYSVFFLSFFFPFFTMCVLLRLCCCIYILAFIALSISSTRLDLFPLANNTHQGEYKY